MSMWRKSSAPAGSAPKTAKRILVISLGELTEFIQDLAAVRLIRDYHVGARITLLTVEPLEALAEKCPYFDIVEADGKPREPQATTQLITRLRGAKYEMVYDLRATSRTNSYFLAMRPWPPLWSGAAQGCSHPTAPIEQPMHRLDRLSAQLRGVGIETPVQLLPDMSWIRPALRDAPRLQPSYFGIRDPYVLLAPSEIAASDSERWASRKYIDLARRVADLGVTPVMVGGLEARGVGAALAEVEPRAKNLVGRTDVFQLAALCERAAFVMGEQAPALHVAAACGVSSVILLPASVDPDLVAPRGRGGVVAIQAPVLAETPVEQVLQQMRNGGAFRASTAA
jgi:ADP-heptose:LPS heptosyltransferase